jgi:hypothetical protein
MDLVFLFIFFFPMMISFYTEFPIIQKFYKYDVSKGYALIVGLPIFLTYISFQAITETFHHYKYAVLFYSLITFSAGLLCTLFFHLKLKFGHIHYGTEKWFMARFYRDILYAVLVALPALIAVNIF